MQCFWTPHPNGIHTAPVPAVSGTDERQGGIGREVTCDETFYADCKVVHRVPSVT
jgi:hypothetical protein